MNAEQAAARCRHLLGLEDIGGPLDLRQAADRARISVRIEADSGAASGRLLFVDGRYSVVLSARGSRQRRRFTLAHELGHWWLHHHTGGPHPEGDLAEERFCNAFAAGFLMPREMVDAVVAPDQRDDVDVLRRLGDQAGMSYSATLVRLAHLRRWRASLLHFAWRRDRWRLQHTTRVPPALAAGISMEWSTQVLLDTLLTSEVGTLPLADRDRVVVPDRAQLRRLGSSHVMALADLWPTQRRRPRALDPERVTTLYAGTAEQRQLGVKATFEALRCHVQPSTVPGMDFALQRTSESGRTQVEVKLCDSAPDGRAVRRMQALLDRHRASECSATPALAVLIYFDGATGRAPAPRWYQAPGRSGGGIQVLAASHLQQLGGALARAR